MLTLYGSMYEAQAKTLDSLSAALPGSAKELIAYLSEQLAESKPVWPAEERARAYYFMGESHYYTGQYRVSNVYYREALEIYESKKNITRQEAVWNNKGVNYDLLELHEQSLRAYEQSLTLARERDDEYGVAQTLLNVALVNNTLSMYEEALERTREAMAIFTRFDDAYHVHLAMLNKAMVLYNTGEYEHFEQLIEEVINGFRSIESTTMLIRSLVNKAVFLMAQNRSESAWPYLHEAGELAESEDPPLLKHVRYNKIRYFMQTGDYTRAYDMLKDFEAALDLSQISGEILEGIMEFYLHVYASTNRPEKIGEIFERRRSLLRQRNQTRALEAMAEFEIIEDIVFLEATITAQQRDIAQQRIVIFIISGFLVVVAALLTGLLLVFRELRRQQKIRALSTFFSAISPRKTAAPSTRSIQETRTLPKSQAEAQVIGTGDGGSPSHESGAVLLTDSFTSAGQNAYLQSDSDDFADEGVESEQMEELFSKIHMLLMDKELYLDTTLRMEDVSRAVGSNTTYISKAINQYSGLNFNKFLNMYRIEHARKLMEDPYYKRVSLVEISEESGFLNMTTFYRNFKDITQMTPALYRKLVKKRMQTEQSNTAVE